MTEEASARRNRRLGIMLGGVALLFYLGFIAINYVRG